MQLAWGGLLVLAGIGVFFRSPQVRPKITEIEPFSSAIWFIYICFYLLGILLIMGGGRKLWENYRKLKGEGSEKDDDT